MKEKLEKDMKENKIIVHKNILNINNLIQMQINEKAGITYENALKSMLRCDPDVLVVGEVRDYKTAGQVITSTFSGHLVLSTIHAENSIGVINRLRDLNLSHEDIKQTIPQDSQPYKPVPASNNSPNKTLYTKYAESPHLTFFLSCGDLFLCIIIFSWNHIL